MQQKNGINVLGFLTDAKATAVNSTNSLISYAKAYIASFGFVEDVTPASTPTDADKSFVQLFRGYWQASKFAKGAGNSDNDTTRVVVASNQILHTAIDQTTDGTTNAVSAKQNGAWTVDIGNAPTVTLSNLSTLATLAEQQAQTAQLETIATNTANIKIDAASVNLNTDGLETLLGNVQASAGNTSTLVMNIQGDPNGTPLNVALPAKTKFKRTDTTEDLTTQAVSSWLSCDGSDYVAIYVSLAAAANPPEIQFEGQIDSLTFPIGQSFIPTANKVDWYNDNLKAEKIRWRVITPSPDPLTGWSIKLFAV